MKSSTKINIKVITETEVKNIYCNKSENLLKVLVENKINISNYCNGNGTCGKCKVRFLENNGELGKVELACFHNVNKDCIIEVIGNNSEFEILSDFFSPGLNDNISEKKLDIGDMLDEKAQSSYGIAIDIGTTTIVFTLVNLKDRKVSDIISILNPQRKFGADVITRIQYALKNDQKLTECIQDTLKEKILDFIKSKPDANFNNVVVAGNTTMLYLLQGLSCEDLATYPFDVKEISFKRFNVNEIFKKDCINLNITLLPCISAFVGADIVSDIFFTDMHNSDEICMLLDIGTNGEMVIGNKDRLLCTATAAGPVFEGANIKSGIGSVAGAINKVKINNHNILYNTIKDAEPIGICGSGVIDIVSELLTNNLMDKTGLLDEELYPEGNVTICKNKNEKLITFTQKDIREVQLAKSAIRAGIEVLIKKFETDYSKISKVYISGGFGTNINIESSINIGMLPKEFVSKIQFIGNGSLGGTIKYLTSNLNIEDTELKLVKDKSKNINLSKEIDFNNLFIKYMSF